MEAAYLKAYKNGFLQERIKKALSILKCCVLCPRTCKVNRLEGDRGVCRTGRYAKVSSYGPHFGEEDPLVGTGGSGTVFFTHCNLLCVFCQNYDISHRGEGFEVTPDGLATIMIRLQERGAHNINFVTPSHVVPHILEALPRAIEDGLNVPLVYNCGGYESIETLALLDGIFDIYMPDLKFADDTIAQRYCNAPDYPERVKTAVKEMHRQVGDLIINERGIAERGLLVRHLVMPEGKSGTYELMGFLAGEVSKNTYVNIMNQYRPCGDAAKFRELSRSITSEEYHEAIQDANAAGITRIDQRMRRGFFL
ncbi:MAG: radical SAM protein [Proteobacteria bacterium]|nr:radical SAM protein [Pseudomonadota bacterium]